jgi:pyruvate,water dikinase
MADVPLVGGKNAALGELISNLQPLGINVPGGFAVTTDAYHYFLQTDGLKDKIAKELKAMDVKNLKDLRTRSKRIRDLIIKTEFPADLRKEIEAAYKQLCEQYKTAHTDVAVRSSATSEDTADASFAGQQETFLNVSGADNVVNYIKKCFASLFTERAVSYRHSRDINNDRLGISVGVQKMVRSDLAASGVMFTLDTETGFDNVAVVSGAWGLGEMVVGGGVTPDEFVAFKPSLEKGKQAIISRTINQKDVKMIYTKTGTKEVPVPATQQNKPCITDKEAAQLANWGVLIEKHFSKRNKRAQPMDIEWAKDGQSGKLYIVQARPETVYGSRKNKLVTHEYRMKESPAAIATGIGVGDKIAAGKVHAISHLRDIGKFQPGEVLVTENTTPDWEPAMKKAAAIVTEKGGRTSHAAIVSRELGIPSVVGTKHARKLLKNCKEATVDCSQSATGYVYDGIRKFEVIENSFEHVPETKTKIMANIGSPEEAFSHHYLPVSGVGLGRLEFIINSYVAVHPNALIDFKKLQKNPKHHNLVKTIEAKTEGYDDKKQFYVDKLAQGIAKIAAAFYPGDVIIRFSDFKTNEYRSLTGGDLYEGQEANPMIGWRGAARYYDPRFSEAFGLECDAMKKVRRDMGLDNVIPMVPFCRTVDEGKKVRAIMTKHGLDKKYDKNFRTYIMCEIPANVMLADEFLDLFDGMSIGSNDLTQLTLGLDRDAEAIAHIGNENNAAVREMVHEVIRACKKRGKYVGICGQAPSDLPDFTRFLLKEGIKSISLSPSAVLQTLHMVAREESRLTKPTKPSNPSKPTKKATSQM